MPSFQHLEHGGEIIDGGALGKDIFKAEKKSSNTKIFKTT
jgi:hypothetical protein